MHWRIQGRQRGRKLGCGCWRLLTVDAMFLASLTLALTSLQVLGFNLGLQEQVLFFLALLLVRVVYYGVDLHTIISRRGPCTRRRVYKGDAHKCMPWSRVTTNGWVPASAVAPVWWVPMDFIDYVAETAKHDALGGLLGQLFAVYSFFPTGLSFGLGIQNIVWVSG